MNHRAIRQLRHLQRSGADLPAGLPGEAAKVLDQPPRALQKAVEPADVREHPLSSAEPQAVPPAEDAGDRTVVLL